MAGDLYQSTTGRSTTPLMLREALQNCGAHDCSVLFVHAGINFGAPRSRRTELLQAMTDTLLQLGPATICFPAFTFSFVNHEVFDQQNTPSRMGVLSEYFRRLPDTLRSADPLMSVAVSGRRSDLALAIGTQSCGQDSTFDMLSRTDGVRFLFLGVRPQDCFTYMHYLEWHVQAPYRHNRDFHGMIRSGNQSTASTATLFVRYPGVYPGPGNAQYERQMADTGIMLTHPFGDNFIHCVPESTAKALWLQLYHRDPNFFITSPFARPLTIPANFEHTLPMVAM